MIVKLKATIEWLLGFKVGNGFAFLLYMVLILIYALLRTASAELTYAAWLAGLGVQTGQRTYTQVTLGRVQAAKQNEVPK
jgi:hypothetical protein